MASRTYSQHCLLARALDLVGERWTLLLVRDLLLGAKRYKELLAGLPGIGTNLLAKRLVQLQEAGVVCKRALPAPASATVYELTEWGRGLEGPILALSMWARPLMAVGPAPGELRKTSWVLLAMREFYRRERAEGLRLAVQLHVALEALFIRVHPDGRLETSEGTLDVSDAEVTVADAAIWRGLLFGAQSVDEAVASGAVQILGDADAFACCLGLFEPPVVRR